MPFALIFAGALLIASGINGKSGQLFTLVKGDIEGGYIYWMFSILVIGALGYSEDLKPLSRAFMALVLVVLVLKAGNPLKNSGGGLFAQLQAGLAASPSSNQ